MEFKVDKDLALFYGILLGDGCLSAVNRKDRKSTMKFITITGSSRDDLPFFENVIAPILRKYRGKETKIKFRKDCNAIEYNFTDERLFDFIASFGFPIGKKENKLFIPKIFYDLDLVSHHISGFFATDGSLVLTKNPNKIYPRLESHVICKDLLREIYNYLSNEGMNGAYYLNKRVNDTRPWKHMFPSYRIQFNGKNNLLLFNYVIGFSNPKYKEKFNKFLEYSEEYDNAIAGITSTNVKPISNRLNAIYYG